MAQESCVNSLMPSDAHMRQINKPLTANDAHMQQDKPPLIQQVTHKCVITFIVAIYPLFLKIICMEEKIASLTMYAYPSVEHKNYLQCCDSDCVLLSCVFTALGIYTRVGEK